MVVLAGEGGSYERGTPVSSRRSLPSEEQCIALVGDTAALVHTVPPPVEVTKFDQGPASPSPN